MVSIYISKHNDYFRLNQFHHIFVPPSSDPKGLWKDCSEDPGKCSKDQILVLQGLFHL